MQISGAQILVQSLRSENVDVVFGYPGGAVLEIYDAIYQLKAFKHILTRHEQGAAHAADAYARATGKVGVCLVTSGPGATNAVTGIATAYYDSIPMVVISGQVGIPAIGTDAFQEVDTVGVTRPCVKHNFLVTDVNDLAETIKKAFHIARTGRPGPVVVDVPKDVTQAYSKFCYPQEEPQIRSYQPVTQGHTGQIKKAVQVLASAKRPLVYFGGGIVSSNSSCELREMVNLLNVPCVSTLMGLGAVPETDPHFVGMLGMHGAYEANLAMQNADVVIALGARFDDRVVSVPDKFLATPKKVIHIDIDPSSIAKRVKVDIPIVGDVKLVLEEILNIWKQKEVSLNHQALESWWRQIEEWRKRECFKYDDSGKEIKPQFVIETLARLTKNNAIIASDVGQHQMFAAQYYPFQRARQWLNSGGLGTMGVGLPYAMGAKIACPDEEVCLITSDGSIQMNIQELSTCKQYGLPIKIINLNNGWLGMVRQWQEFYYQDRCSETDLLPSQPDFVKLVEAYGHVGMRIDKKEDVEGAIQEALSLKDKLVFMDFVVARGENVFPMVGNGKGLNEMVLPPHMRETKADAEVNDVTNRNYDTRSVP